MVLLTANVVASFGQTRLSLQQSKDIAIRNNIQLQNSTLELDAAKEVKENAFTNYFPKVTATGMGMSALNPIVKYSLPGGNLPVYDGNPANIPSATQFAYFPGANISLLSKASLGVVNAVQPVYMGGKINTGNKLAKINVEVKQKQRELTENEVLLKTEQQYWQLLSLQEKHETLARYEKLLANLHTQVNDAYKSGLIIRNDLLKIQLKQSELKINKNKLNNGKKLALMQFCQTIGIPYDSTLVVEEDFQMTGVPEDYYAETSSVLSRKNEYALLEKSVEASRLQTKMKKGDYLPQLAIGAGGYYYNSLEHNSNGILNGLVYGTISIPISDWWGGFHAIKEQKLRERIAENTFQDARGLLLLQMEKAWSDVNESYMQVIIMEETMKQAEENLKVNSDSYSSGIVTLSDLLEAQALQVETQDKLIESKTRYRLAITTYLQVTGR